MLTLLLQYFTILQYFSVPFVHFCICFLFNLVSIGCWAVTYTSDTVSQIQSDCGSSDTFLWHWYFPHMPLLFCTDYNPLTLITPYHQPAMFWSSELPCPETRENCYICISALLRTVLPLGYYWGYYRSHPTICSFYCQSLLSTCQLCHLKRWSAGTRTPGLWVCTSMCFRYTTGLIRDIQLHYQFWTGVSSVHCLADWQLTQTADKWQRFWWHCIRECLLCYYSILPYYSIFPYLCTFLHLLFCSTWWV